MEQISDDGANQLLEFLRENRNFDVAAIDSERLMAILQERLAALKLGDVTDYIDYLQVRPDEINYLTQTLSGSGEPHVLFQDAGLWKVLREKILPDVILSKDPLRFWCVGVDRGQSVYSLAIALAELIGITGIQERIKFFATDAEEANLILARQASFAKTDMDGISQHLRHKYFIDNTDEKLTVRPDLRRLIVFGKHDVLVDPPVSKMDLILCQNALLSYDRERQRTTLSRLRFALKPHKYLVIGTGQTIENGMGFAQSSHYSSIYSKIASNGVAVSSVFNQIHGDAQVRHAAFLDAVFDQGPLPQLLLDPDGLVLMISQRAREMFGLFRSDLGRPLQDLEISYRPIELRSLLEQAQSEQKVVSVKGVVRNVSGSGSQIVDVLVRPIYEAGRFLGSIVQYQNVTDYHSLREQFVSLNQQLQAANEELQSAHEELETTNEELNSTNEELETTNEELQSTNEELETMNEELRSTNAELEATNSEQRLLSERMTQTNRFLERILASIQSAVIVLDTHFNVVVWNRKAEDLWGLRDDEVIRKNFFALDMGLPVSNLKTPLRDFVGSEERNCTLTVEAINRRGKQITCNVRITPLGDSRKSGSVLIITETTEAERDYSV